MSIPSPEAPAAPAAPAAEPPPSALAGLLRTLTPRAIGLTVLLSLGCALLLEPLFAIPFSVVLGRTLFVGFITLLARSAVAQWRLRLLPPWVLQSLTVLVAAIAATLAAYLVSTGGDFMAFVSHEGRVQGFVLIAGLSTIAGLMLALGALERERNTEAKALELELALQRSRLERQAADARLALLRAQVEPHFLFNTLANIEALVETGSPRAPAVLRSLIAYLKATMPRLDDGDGRLEREFELVRSYLELMHLRMPDRLRYEVRLAPELAGFPCPPMLLLTLVENAVRHGIDPTEAGGSIVVRAERAGAQVRLSVHDDGAGLAEAARTGTGLKNLRERLQAFYGEGARLELSDVVPHGLRADLVIDTDALPGGPP